MMRKIGQSLTVIGLAAVMAGLQPASAQSLDQALGVWADEDGNSNIEVAPCDEEEFLCARVIWLKEPHDDAGQPKTDRHNPDKSLRSRPILGLTIMEDLHPDRKKIRLTGQVYNSRDGKTYEVFLEPKGETMEVTGCILKILCGSQTWTRVR